MKVKIPTIIGIVLLFGYFIRESFKNPSSIDPTQVVMVGNDTLGRDWGAMADQKEKEKAELLKLEEDKSNVADHSDTKSLLERDDPYNQKEKLNSADYSTVQAADGREIITGYNPNQGEEDGSENYETRHQKELTKKVTKEPEMKYRE